MIGVVVERKIGGVPRPRDETKKTRGAGQEELVWKHDHGAERDIWIFIVHTNE